MVKRAWHGGRPKVSHMDDDERPWHTRVKEADSKERCQSVGYGDQCWFIVIPGAKYCYMHGQGVLQATKKAARKLYNIEKYREKVDALHQEEPHLDEELGIQRMVLQETLNKFEGLELITNSGNISKMIREIRETLVANLKLKSEIGQLMDKATISRLCDEIVAIIARRVAPSDIDAVVGEVAGAVGKAVASRLEA